jgi:peptidoglycan/LPS O-acetylase OafA/YrhL
MTVRQPALPSLTGMRWLAAALVFGFHVHLAEYFGGPRTTAVIHTLFGAGSAGVSFFFILSGFVLAWSVRVGDDSRRFWRRRLARVYPLHAVTAVLALVVGLTLAHGTIPTAREATLNALLVHPWSPVPHDSQTLNPVSWSLGCEAFFYALFPLLFVAVRRMRVRGLYLTGALSIVAVVVISVVATAGSSHFYPLARLPEFVLGVVLACLVRRGAWRGPGLKVSVVVLAAGYLAAAFAPGMLQYATCTIIGFTLVIPAAAVADLRHGGTWLGQPLMVKLGELSFAFYMVHLLVIRVGENVYTRHPNLPLLPGLALAVAVFAAALGLAWLLYELVERPARKLLVRPWRRDREAERAPVAAATRQDWAARDQVAQPVPSARRELVRAGADSS